MAVDTGITGERVLPAREGKEKVTPKLKKNDVGWAPQEIQQILFAGHLASPKIEEEKAKEKTRKQLEDGTGEKKPEGPKSFIV